MYTGQNLSSSPLHCERARNGSCCILQISSVKALLSSWLLRYCIMDSVCCLYQTMYMSSIYLMYNCVGLGIVVRSFIDKFAIYKLEIIGKRGSPVMFCYWLVVCPFICKVCTIERAHSQLYHVIYI